MKKPAEMRDFLFGAVNDITDKEIAKANANLKELLPLLEKYSTEELSAMNKATKAKVTNDLPFVDGQINEKERDIVIKRDIDLAEWELLKKDLQKQLQENIEQQKPRHLCKVALALYFCVFTLQLFSCRVKAILIFIVYGISKGHCGRLRTFGNYHKNIAVTGVGNIISYKLAFLWALAVALEL